MIKYEKDGVQVTVGQFKARHPEVVFSGAAPSQKLAEHFGYSVVRVPDPLPWSSYTEARLAVVQWINGLTSQTISLYPDAVQKRWAIEEEAARAVKAGTADAYQTQIVTEEGAAKGRTAIEHADAIIVNADRFHGIADQVNKLFLATDKALSDASSPREYPAIFATAQAQAAPLAAAYGLEV
ncbi:hypothetical protein HKX54_02395 [Sulfitobacter sp. M57]|uniref:hypothetical protein n=1 Tax=unclassified Sulfitobacter TaxID=196795 RepID=UPI0023E1B660|nr:MULTISPECIES: hypothetical protein [unclassified Sulfitobacter]MDF3413293.1 hypothetical protein [Sulfitobacter sp. KE5]MDF3421427.1 hypothetical protein [Sulfitobacter sp. KE43]MDF3431840.1 hypothetical protein [Sulfitobacter sp. KE42]MDF3457480.1 hypothetical protein [Sulfitobacter sp. S74]MDF3461382.1 hypothetical protein [Sulfitobacter sp. Ks18]